MRVVVAPDSFKGSLTAVEAAAAMAAGVRDALPQAEVALVPMADGGEGTVVTLVAGTGGRLETLMVTGPLGYPVPAHFGLLGGGETAVIEMAAASGLLLVPPAERNPLVTTTYGTGELIRAALDLGCRRILVGIGGSATTDGGVGMLQALGGAVLTAAGAAVGYGGGALAAAARIDLSCLDPRLEKTQLLVACDVDNPLTGPRGAAAVYGPQKGATPAMVAELDRNLTHLADLVGGDFASVPGAGAAGGLGFGLMAFLGARLVPGVQVVMDVLCLDDRLAGASVVLTGEGRTDAQTLAGKVPLGVAQRAGRQGIPAVVISGSLGEGAERLSQHGVVALFAAAPAAMPLAEAMARAGELLRQATAEALREVLRAQSKSRQN
ncbi:MAG: glycerate kinase [Symbiobacteriia bacterium]